MSLDETLELDTIIEKSNRAIEAIDSVNHNSGTDHKDDFTGLQTHTGIFNPPKSGEYTIKVNGETLKIKVTDSTVIIDDFEDGDVSEYQGSVSNARINNTFTKNGSYGLSFYGGDDNGNQYTIATDSGLNYFPKSGDTIKFWYKTNTTDKSDGFYFGVPNPSNTGMNTFPDGYEVEFGTSTAFALRKDSSIIESTSYYITENNEYQIVIDWGSNGNISISIEDSAGNQVKSLSTTDSTYNSGGIGFESGGTGSAAGDANFDYIRTI